MVSGRLREFAQSFGPAWIVMIADVVSALDSLSLLGFREKDERVNSALDWLRDRQSDDGSFRLKLLRDSDRSLDDWICLAICRMFRRFYPA